MTDLLEIEVEIVKIINYQGSALANDVMWLSKLYVSAEIAAISSSFERKSCRMAAITSASPKAVVLASMLSLYVDVWVQI